MELLTEGEIEERIYNLCDDEFLDKLSEVARLYGWLGDYTEVVEFVTTLYDYRDKPRPELEPYEIRG